MVFLIFSDKCFIFAPAPVPGPAVAPVARPPPLAVPGEARVPVGGQLQLRPLLAAEHLGPRPRVGQHLVVGGARVGGVAGLEAGVLRAVLEGLDVAAAGGLAPARHPDPRPLALPGVGGQHLQRAAVMACLMLSCWHVPEHAPHLAVALAAGTLAHVDAARLEVELRRHRGVARGEQRAADGGAVELRLDAALQRDEC